MVTVYNVLHACWGKSSWRSHVKKFSKTKNGRQVYWTLHTLLLGGQRVVSTGSTIVTKLQSFRYEGDRKNFDFDKYVIFTLSSIANMQTSKSTGLRLLPRTLRPSGSRTKSGTLLSMQRRHQSTQTVPILLTLTLLRMLMWNSSAQIIQPMTEGPDKLPLLPSVGMEAGISHTSMTKDKDPRPLTNARRGLFSNLK
jgi:hypothetical protein